MDVCSEMHILSSVCMTRRTIISYSMAVVLRFYPPFFSISFLPLSFLPSFRFLCLSLPSFSTFLPLSLSLPSLLLYLHSPFFFSLPLFFPLSLSSSLSPSLLPSLPLSQIIVELTGLCHSSSCSHEQRLLKNMGAHHVILELLQVPYKVIFNCL